MNITRADSKYSEIIAQRLSSKFSTLNRYFGYNRYKTDFERIHSLVVDRINSPNSEFSYFILLTDSGEFAGFVNLLASPLVFEILVLDLMDAHDTLENATSLLQFAVSTLKDLGADNILTEAGGFEKNYAHALVNMKAHLVEQKFRIN